MGLVRLSGLAVPCFLIACAAPKVKPRVETTTVRITPGSEDSSWQTVPPPSGADDPSAKSPDGGPPFPNARDTMPWDHPGADTRPGLPGRDDSIRGPDSSGLPAPYGMGPVSPAKTPPAYSRPDGIVARPRPPGLPEKIRVLLSQGNGPIALYSLGEVQILAEGKVADSQGVKSISVARLATLKGRFVIRRNAGGFAVEGGKGMHATASRRLRVIPVNPYNLIDVGGAVYRGGLHILGDAGKDRESKSAIAVVNVLGVEDYLRGVLPYEMGTLDRTGLEALKAQAIVARTYAYKRMMRAGVRDFHVYSNVQDQVYKGVRGEYLLSDRAVWETRGMAVTHADTLALCYYHSTCSGRTASKHEVWGGDSIPYLVTRSDTDGIGDAFCQASRFSSWKEEWDLAKLAGILKRNLRSAGVADVPAFRTVKSVQATERASCGRIRTLRIETDKGPILVKGDKVRWALRPPATEEKILPSASFELKTSGSRLSAQGKAFGHGVGLCQFGAMARARDGQDFRQVIEAYYRDVRIAEFK